MHIFASRADHISSFLGEGPFLHIQVTNVKGRDFSTNLKGISGKNIYIYIYIYIYIIYIYIYIYI